MIERQAQIKAMKQMLDAASMDQVAGQQKRIEPKNAGK
jgi:hypothetical protein